MKKFNPETDLVIPNVFLQHPDLNYSQQIIIAHILKYSKHGICHMRKIDLAKIIGYKYGLFRMNLTVLRKKGFIKDIDNGLAVFLNDNHYILDTSIYGRR